ncbi:MAG: hypothetical protein QG587_1412, partial [Chloroflexota bacterium]|nr:hypothetical protein [Chloroflexota bacterium]
MIHRRNLIAAAVACV